MCNPQISLWFLVGNRFKIMKRWWLFRWWTARLVRKKKNKQKSNLKTKLKHKPKAFQRMLWMQVAVKGWKERMDKLWKKDQLQDMKQAIIKIQEIPWVENSWKLGEQQGVITIHAYVHTQLLLFLMISLLQGSSARWTLDLSV